MRILLAWFWVVSGTSALSLGVIGIVAPYLPTTPFLLLAAFCYARGSSRLHGWLLNHPWFGSYIRNWTEGRGISLRNKVLAISLLFGTVSYSIFRTQNFFVSGVLVCIGLGVSVYIVTRPTARS